jgi:hypothetical protein
MDSNEITDTDNDPEFYPLDPSEVYSWGRGYPQSCECKESNVQLSSCDLFACTCTCDVTAGVCDYSCCCDPDCSSTQIARFNTLDVCLPEGGEQDEVEECYSSTQLYKINGRERLGGDTTAQSAVGEALCIQKKNYVFKVGELACLLQFSPAIYVMFDGTGSESSY